MYAFLVDMENTNRLKTSLMGGTVQMVEKTPDWVGTSYRMFRHLVGGLYYEFTARNVEAVQNERVVQTTEGWIMENLLSGTHVLRVRPELRDTPDDRDRAASHREDPRVRPDR